jgi:hypothetical protein
VISASSWVWGGHPSIVGPLVSADTREQYCPSSDAFTEPISVVPAGEQRTNAMPAPAVFLTTTGDTRELGGTSAAVMVSEREGERPAGRGPTAGSMLGDVLVDESDHLCA